LNAVFRVDASWDIGSGHVMRCLTLADELAVLGYRIRFVMRQFPGEMSSYVSLRGYSFTMLPSVNYNPSSHSDSDYTTWLMASIDQDADEFCAASGGADLVIVDHYGIDFNWEKLVIDVTNAKLVVIDDLMRDHKADVIVDQTVGRSVNAYCGIKHKLVGADYAMLKPGFAKYRAIQINRRLKSDPLRVLVSFGGVDKSNVTLSVLEALSEREDLELIVLLNDTAPNYSSVENFCVQSETACHLSFVEDMALLMSDVDVAVGAPGATSWERACLGIPSVIIPIAENQVGICNRLVELRVALTIDVSEVPDKLLVTLDSIILRWNEFKRNALRLGDGRGAKRVAGYLKGLTTNSDRIISIRPSSEHDIELVYAWQVYPETRKYSHSSSIPSFEEHKSWMSSKLTSFLDFFYIIEFNGGATGVLRLDRQVDNQYLISIYLSPEYYGKGIATEALKLLDVIHPDHNLIAEVQERNTASQKIFENSNFIRLNHKTFKRPALI